MNGKVIGIFTLLVLLCLFMSFATSDFLKEGNIQNLLSRTSLYGILGIGVAFVIISGGIDLSIGSVVCLSGVLLSLFLHVDYRAADQISVAAVSAADQSILLKGGISELQPGDRVRLSGGQASPRLLTVRTVEQSNAGPLIGVQEPLARNEDKGELTRTVAVSRIDRGGSEIPADGSAAAGKARVVMEGVYRLTARDRLTLVHSESGLSTQEIMGTEVSAEQTIVWLRNDPGERIASDCVAIALRRHQRLSIPMALLCVLLIAGVLGLIHGLLVTQARLQPFVVTLCGLLIYRGLSRWLTSDNPAGFGEVTETLGTVATGRFPVIKSADGVVTFGLPYPLFFLLAIGTVAGIVLSRTVWGRYLLALGRSEEAARFSGINTARVTLLAYVICTVLAAIGGMLFSLNSGSISPSSFGNFFELYAIAAAVLGGCSLRGGEGSIVGVIIGTAVMQVLNNMIILLGISDRLEYAIIGSVILIGVLADEFVRRFAAQRRLKQAAR